MQHVKELDQFGTHVKWRFKSKDTFKSHFGGITFIILFSIFIAKLIFFSLKVGKYGFANNQISESFPEGFQVTNLTDLKFIILTDLGEKFSKDKNLSTAFSKDLKNFNLSNYLDIQPVNLNPQIKLKDHDCKKLKKFKDIEKEKNDENKNNIYSTNNHTDKDFKNAFNETIDKGNIVIYFDILSAKCLVFDENNSSINISRSETLLKGTPAVSELQLNIMAQFGILFKMENELVNFLNRAKQNFSVYLFFSNYKINPENFKFQEYYSAVGFTIDVNLQTSSQITFRKITVSNVIEIDIFDIGIFKDDKYSINRDSLKVSKFSREKTENEIKTSYEDFITFSLNIWEENNSVTYLTTDNILAVLGGFLEITFSIGEFFITMHNENLVRKLFNLFFYENLKYYDENMMNLKNKLEFQKIYFNPFDEFKKNAI